MMIILAPAVICQITKPTSGGRRELEAAARRAIYIVWRPATPPEESKMVLSQRRLFRCILCSMTVTLVSPFLMLLLLYRGHLDGESNSIERERPLRFVGGRRETLSEVVDYGKGTVTLPSLHLHG